MKRTGFDANRRGEPLKAKEKKVGIRAKEHEIEKIKMI
jgi:hypothetical protein